MEAPSIYPVGPDKKYSIFELLGNFANPNFHTGHLSRLSDLHVKVGEPIAFRIDASLSPIDGGVECTNEMVEGLLFPLLNDKQIATLRGSDTEDLDIGYHWKEQGLTFRLNVFRDREGLAFVVRMLPRSIPGPEEIGLPNEKVWQDIIQLKQGLVLISGVTGAGKSTTMNSLVSRISQTRSCRIITLEDPVEYIHAKSSSIISQREIGTHINSYAQGLRSALREDPDIILVGEMRDPETISLALTAAETGHLVFSTIHTRDVIGAITRIIDSFPAERQNNIATQISFSISYIISQKLVPLMNGKGRTPAAEVLKVTNAIANQIRQKNLSQIYSSMETQSHDGMNTLESHLSKLYEAGKISAEDAEFYANDLKSLKL